MFQCMALREIAINSTTSASYDAFLSFLGIVNFYSAFFYFAKPFAQMWKVRVVIFQAPFRIYRIAISEIIDFQEVDKNGFTLKVEKLKSIKVNMKMVKDESEKALSTSFVSKLGKV